jgi:hypothetical protein
VGMEKAMQPAKILGNGGEKPNLPPESQPEPPPPKPEAQRRFEQADRLGFQRLAGSFPMSFVIRPGN